VVALDPKNEMPLVLSKCEGIPRANKVKGLYVLRNNVLLDHSDGLFRWINWFKLRKQGSDTLSANIAKEGALMMGIMKKHIK
jgi:hypothetical protein